jgi:hypothetical protein
LIEESRTNLLTSSIPQAGVWSSVNTTLISNSEIAPDGTQTATLINSNLIYGAHYINLNSSLTTATNYTQTFFVKAGTTRFVQVAPSTGFTATTFANFELSGDGIIGTSTVDSASIQRFPNGWYRIRVTQLSTSNPAGGRMLLVLGTSLTNGRLPQTPVLSCYVWGAQLEAGAFATSYIPTTASTVTRSVDNADMTGTNFSSWYNSTEGSLFVASRVNALGSSGYPGIAYVDDGTVNNCMGFYVDDAGTDRIGAEAYLSGRAQYTLFSSSATTANKLNKAISSYSINNFSAAFDTSSQIQRDTNGSIPTVNRLRIGALRGGVYPLNGTISRLTYYPIALTSNQLINLTS